MGRTRMGPRRTWHTVWENTKRMRDGDPGGLAFAVTTTFVWWMIAGVPGNTPPPGAQDAAGA